jgi:hypothetical protein
MVVDVAKLSAGREDYYLREIAGSHEEYLSGHGESPGRWYGQGAVALGQSGQASTEAFQRISEGRHPETGELRAERDRLRGLLAQAPGPGPGAGAGDRPPRAG